MNSIFIPILLLFTIFHFYSNFVEANEEFKFIEEQFENCKNLENERRNFEAMKNNAEYGWEKIEPKNELEKCIIDFDIAEYLNDIETKFMRIGNLLNNKGDISRESRQLRIFSAELEKLHLNKELMKILGAKIGDGIQDMGIIQISDSKDGSTHGRGKWQPDEGHFSDLNRQINELISKKSPKTGNSYSNIQRGEEHDHQKQIQAETNNGRVQILKSIYDFREKLNTEIKWLNMMLWLKKSKAEMEKIGEKLTKEKEKQIVELFENFSKRHFNEPEKESIWKLVEKPKTFSNDYSEIENCWRKESNSLREELEKLKKKSNKIKTKKYKGNPLKVAGDSAGMSSDRRSPWPHYDELLAKTNFKIKLNLGSIKIPSGSEEKEQINKLKELVKKWNYAVVKVRAKINGLIEDYLKMEYDGIFYCVALHRVTSMAFHLLMGVFEWENVEWKMATIGHLAEVMEGYIQILSIINPKSPFLLDDQTVYESDDIQIQVVYNAFTVLTFYKKLKEKIVVANGANDDKKMEEFGNEIDKFMKRKLPLPDDKNGWEEEYWKWYEEKANKSLSKSTTNNLQQI